MIGEAPTRAAQPVKIPAPLAAQLVAASPRTVHVRRSCRKACGCAIPWSGLPIHCGPWTCAVQGESRNTHTSTRAHALRVLTICRARPAIPVRDEAVAIAQNLTRTLVRDIDAAMGGATTLASSRPAAAAAAAGGGDTHAAAGTSDDGGDDGAMPTVVFDPTHPFFSQASLAMAIQAQLPVPVWARVLALVPTVLSRHPTMQVVP